MPVGKFKRIDPRPPIEASLPMSPPLRLALIGEAAGEQEEKEGRPFVGASGNKLDDLLESAGIDRSACLVTNVIMKHPPLNDFKFFFGKERGEDRTYYLRGTGWLKSEYYSEFERLKQELIDNEIEVAVALGGKPLWALTGEERITKCRGTIMDCQLVPGIKVIPTFHPAYVIRTGGWSEDVVADLRLARDTVGGVTYASDTEIWIEPTLGDILEFKARYLDAAEQISVDIETEHTKLHQITCIGFSADDKVALVIPFCDFTKRSGSYWGTLEDEMIVWEIVREILERDDTIKIGQNVIFDFQYLYWYGIQAHGPFDDTMLLSHAIAPERPKDLAYLYTTYGTDKRPWKTMVSFSSNNKEGV